MLEATGARGGALACLLLAILAGSGCVAHYKDQTRRMRQAYEDQRTDVALAELDSLAVTEDVDPLLAGLDRGMLLHAAGRHAESVAVLTEARRLSERRELVLLTEEAGSGKVYRTSDLEKQLLDLTLALGYAGLGDLDAALVEIRRLDDRLSRLENEDRPYWDRLAVARYVGGVLYEQAGADESAFIDYRKAHRIQRLGAAGAPLVRLARALDRPADQRAVELSYPGLDARPLSPGEGEVVVLVAAGLSPHRDLVTKTVGSGEQQMTQSYMNLVPRRWARRPATVAVGEATAEAVTLTSLDEIARERGPLGHVQDTERPGTVAASWGHVLLGCLCWPVGMVTTTAHAADKGILAQQSWLSLPAEYQVVRLRLPAGTHEVTVRLAAERSVHRVEVPDGGVVLVTARHYAAVH